MYIYIYNGKLQNINSVKGDVTVVPNGASLISESCWSIFCKNSTEASVVLSLGVEDIRQKV